MKMIFAVLTVAILPCGSLHAQDVIGATLDEIVGTLDRMNARLSRLEDRQRDFDRRASALESAARTQHAPANPTSTSYRSIGSYSPPKQAVSLYAAEVVEQGVEFVVVLVEPRVTRSRSSSSELIAYLQPAFDHRPVVLMGCDSYGDITYYGRHDIVDFLATVDASSIGFSRYTLNSR